MITSSVSLRWKRSERNSAPSTGTSPSPGQRRCRSVRALSCSRPAMAKLWPLPSSTVVSARRTVSAGIWIEELPELQADRALLGQVADLRAAPSG